MPTTLVRLARRLNDRGRGFDLAVLAAVCAFLTAVVLSSPPDATVDTAGAPASAQVADGQAGH
ncbi:hypothetical protein [Nitrospirillum pindoramense]|uniref:Uncharacterized protein n=1 Tax=Nitrospirillum amazonense TaxID=28077 RepID=A0A560HIW7_9PROT|nr:hypothetical protein [Nitrospirillum amazonense]TWB45519.1 hypothetical protein FBZ90_102478 [Nitrospirillum amazonense]